MKLTLLNLSFSRAFTLLLLITIGSGCTVSKGGSEIIPVWTYERPIDSSYYIGIAGVSKADFPYNAVEVAKENALNALAREIRVKISSSSVLSTLQVNKWVEESFVSNIESAVSENLEGYTLVDQFENESEVFVYYRLSKSEYLRILSERKRVALGISYGHYLDAERKKSEGAISSAIERYLMGLDAMSKYLGELNPYTDENGREFNLDRALLNGVSDGISNLKISSKPEIRLTLADGYTGEIEVEVKSEDLVSGMPLKYSYSRGKVSARGRTSTSLNGKAIILLNGFDPGTLRSELRVEVDVSSLAQVLTPMSPLAPMVKSMNSTPLILPITLDPPKVIVIGDEKMFGRTTQNGQLTSTLRAALMEKGVEIVDDFSTNSPDVITLSVQSDTKAGGEGAGFYTAYLNATIELIDPHGKLILQKNLERIKGVQLNRITAGNEAYRKAQKEIKGRFIETFMEALYK
ncbi:MAG: hypothetical protein COA49_09280 [Bacteroidetes bacterium]|nr:MAG: hypothetical protein COA49_09280 [Bacteroidota bacterium]